MMIFEAREREDGSMELALDAEGITHLEQGLAELRYMDSGEALASPPTTDNEFMLKRVQDRGARWRKS